MGQKILASYRRRVFGAAVGVVLDRFLTEPRNDIHPVALFGRALQGAEKYLYADQRAAGIVHAALGTGLGISAGMFVRSTTAATCIAVGGQSLADAARAVDSALQAWDLEQARTLLPTLVGRNPEGLSRPEISRAVIESVAENTVDAVVAPAFWAAIGGAPAVLGYRAVNTLDSMVGHHSSRYEHYGWASARLDDVAAFVPARLTALLVAGVRPARARHIYRAVRHQAPAHPSPNAGVAEAAFAAALGIRLGGLNHYGERDEERPTLGCGNPPGDDDIGRAIRLSLDVGWALVGVLAFASIAAVRKAK